MGTGSFCISECNGKALHHPSRRKTSEPEVQTVLVVHKFILTHYILFQVPTASGWGLSLITGSFTALQQLPITGLLGEGI